MQPRRLRPLRPLRPLKLPPDPSCPIPPSPAVADAWVEVGRIIGAFGVNGALKVETFVEPSVSVLRTARWWRLQGRSGPPRDVEVASVKVQFDSLIATLEDAPSRESAMRLKGERISVNRADFPAPASDEFYWADLIGCTVRNRAGVELGAVASVDDHGADPLLNVDGRHLIPLVDAYVLDVSTARREIIVDWSEDWS